MSTLTKKAVKNVAVENANAIINKLEAQYKVTELLNGSNLYSTTNYNSLKFYKANRPIRRHIKGIIKSMQTYGNLSVGMVAEVNGVLYIIDGQHRFTACKELGIPFEYKKVVLNDTKDIVSLITSLNSNSKTWSDLDYLHAWSVEGIQTYKDLEEINNEFKGVSFSNLKDIFGWKPKQFREGTFNLTREELFKGIRVIRLLNDIIPILYKSGKINAQPMRAVIDAMMLPNYNHKKMVETIKNNKDVWSGDEIILRTQLFQEVSNF